MPDTIRDAVDRYNATVKAIRANSRLSDDGRRAELREAHESVKAQLAQLHRQQTTVTSARVGELRRDLFASSSADVVAQRDAHDRVARCGSPEELGELMQTAHLNGDEGFLRAGFARAWEESRKPGHSRWSVLVDAYIDEHPTARGQLDELAELSSPARVTTDALSVAIVTPAELRPGYRPTPQPAAGENMAAVGMADVGGTPIRS
jgi:hypothetical protein